MRLRSQMAEGLLRAVAGDRFEVHSAGTVATGVNPVAIRVMAEIGIDISRHASKALDRYLATPLTGSSPCAMTRPRRVPSSPDLPGAFTERGDDESAREVSAVSRRDGEQRNVYPAHDTTSGKSPRKVGRTMTEIRRPPEFCPKWVSRSIAPAGQEKVLSSPSGMPWQEGWTWRCEGCGYEWVRPGAETAPD